MRVAEQMFFTVSDIGKFYVFKLQMPIRWKEGSLDTMWWWNNEESVRDSRWKCIILLLIREAGFWTVVLYFKYCKEGKSSKKVVTCNRDINNLQESPLKSWSGETIISWSQVSCHQNHELQSVSGVQVKLLKLCSFAF